VVFTQAIRFLFIPEAALSAIFLGIFVLLFVFGVKVQQACRAKIAALADEAAAEYARSSRSLPIELYLKKRLEPLSAKEGILEGIPDTFVSIGILATFIGLGIAIQGAAELLSTDQIELDKLIGLLGVIAFKFQTSVWGILLSLVFRRMFVERYYEMREDVIDQTRTLLYSKERDSVQTLVEKQNAFLEKQQAFISEHLTTFVEAIHAQVAASQEMGRHTKQVHEELAAFREEHCALEADFSQKLQASWTELLAKLQEFGDRMAAEQQELSAKSYDILIQMNHHIDDLNRVAQVNTVTYRKETTEELRKALGTTIGLMQEKYIEEIQRFTEKLSAALAGIDAHMTKMHDELNEQQKQLEERQKLMGEQQSAHSGQMKTWQQRMNEEQDARQKQWNEEQTARQKAQTAWLKQQTTWQKQLGTRQKQVEAQQDASYQQLTTVFENVAQVVTHLETELQQVPAQWEKLSASLQQNETCHRELTEQTMTTVCEQLETLRASQQEAQADAVATLHEIQRLLEAQKRVLRENGRAQKTLHDEAQAAIEQVADDVKANAELLAVVKGTQEAQAEARAEEQAQAAQEKRSDVYAAVKNAVRAGRYARRKD
jgi:DNA repair exonuclease SbcCD ATPase subunit